MFFSVRYSGRSDLFQNLSIWQEEKFREMQGTYPVIFLSFASVKEISFSNTRTKINREVSLMFELMIEDWFLDFSPAYNNFIKALLLDDKKAMNLYMNRVALATFSYFDTGKHPSETAEPERFYHGFVLGLMVDLAERYTITSNRKSGFGRYDVLLEPVTDAYDAIILEFKVHGPDDGDTLADTVREALDQIERKKYSAALEAKGIHKERIRKYGFAFEGKTVLIG